VEYFLEYFLPRFFFFQLTPKTPLNESRLNPRDGLVLKQGKTLHET